MTMDQGGGDEERKLDLSNDQTTCREEIKLQRISTFLIFLPLVFKEVLLKFSPFSLPSQDLVDLIPELMLL